MRSKVLQVVAILAVAVVFSACKEDGPPPKTDEQIQLEKLTGTWILPSPAPSNTVTVQGNDGIFSFDHIARGNEYLDDINGFEITDIWECNFYGITHFLSP